MTAVTEREIIAKALDPFRPASRIRALSRSVRPCPSRLRCLVAAGDIWQADIKRGLEFLTRLARGKPVVFVIGNHEYWRGTLGTDLQKARDLTQKTGVTLLENEAVTLSGCHFIGATLWTDYKLAGGLADEKNPTGELISVLDDKGARPFTIADCANMHSGTREYLKAEVSGHDSPLPLVVVTHHAPHPDCLPQQVRGTWAAGNCASDLSELTDSSKAALWIHGHIHESCDFNRPRGTRSGRHAIFQSPF